MRDVLILCYHAVSASWNSPLAVKPEAFERQVAYLLARGWYPTTFAQAALQPSHPQTLAITFDDAYMSVFEHAAPILRRLGVPATIFVTTSRVPGGTLRWQGIEHWIHTPQETELSALEWDQLAELTERGWEIGSHTRTHPHLTELDDEQLMLELKGSREDCAARLGRECISIAYPYGDVDARVARYAAAAGYLAGASLSSRLEPRGPHRQPRVGIYHADSWWRFRLKANRAVRELRATPLWLRRS